ncbi:hypothetical protein OG874_00020 [Nocardia sp. NBC_00565]|uniref:hypothetical protein n=1 Tax=Nocardia sp. NBC_00565 TaxID=2975993 RepID=UPI002E7FE6EB|nr:hypothetical protein [Nocardia sp. NBC_00565]WUC03639.1 hypothetical protein OG874_00020 [Nocardia sp. NBC_00565]
MSDLTLATARAERDALAARTDVLDKVGVLRSLPGGMYVTTEMAAEFYEVSVELIRRVVSDNRAELDSDGYRVTIRSAFESEYGSLSNLDPRARQIALFPRRAVLRIGMLLRDSDVARRVRDYLLNSEERERTLDPANLTRLQILEIAMDSERRALELAAQVEADRPMVERAKQHAGGSGMETRTQFFREVKAWAQKNHGVVVKRDHVNDFLSTLKLGLFVRGRRGDSGEATAWAIEKGYADNAQGTSDSGHNYATGKLTARGQQYAWERIVRYIDANGTLALPRQIGSAQVAQVVDADKLAATSDFADADNMVLPGMEGSA